MIEYIETVEDQLKVATADRAEALAQVADLRKLLEMTMKDLEETKAKLNRMETFPDTIAGTSERLHRMMVLAEDETAALRERTEKDVAALWERAERETAGLRDQAKKETDSLRQATNEEAAAIREECSQLIREVEARRTGLDQEHSERSARLTSEHQQLMTKANADYETSMNQAQSDANRLLQETAEQCNRLESESEARWEQAWRNAESGINELKDTAARNIAEQEAVAAKRGEFLIRMAAKEANRRIGQAQQKMDELRQLQGFVAGQFQAAHSALTTAAGQLLTDQLIDSGNEVAAKKVTALITAPEPRRSEDLPEQRPASVDGEVVQEHEAAAL
ncbi:hypothetical protein D5S17_33445 [Pseudonocardiaceae bacterium YIM PH 21723]|nr:hypothetical protein D5S17_33445 [Pseudonocardiaceae bacterium YIM PH 21723]